MPCTICGSSSHIRSNTKYHPKSCKKSSKRSGKRRLTISGSKSTINKMKKRIGGAKKKGLLADLLKGIDLRIQSL